ncbi:long-chain acyl-CoA synthetase [Austwickia chelonae]|uniref:Acyl-CoA synthetase n=1 Tax=Austwickia chelonae NBRC 105200 TaxID=1184607 RepID=K6V540_9MICO|nr:long-chain fatty acid--CoA ligase [Austwickia chelonae]GAB77318.1 long-chain-fatty-acid--CoA ligase FadD [Austwickia chelonae NBRC 105200]SEW07687.1 long-chain acyl-CoA synthetase [Austwickia chelonae]
MEHPHLIGLIDESASHHGHRTALSVKRSEQWIRLSYTALKDQTRHIANALVRAGIAPGDRVAVFAGNSPEWTLADLGIMTAGAITVTIYQTSSPEQVRHILADSGAAIVFVGSAAEARRLAPVREELPELKKVFSLSTSAEDVENAPPGLIDGTLADLLAQPTDPEVASTVEAHLRTMGHDTLATIVYTSGTTGEPKGVCLSHGNILAEVLAMKERFHLSPGLRSMCFLPLSHVFERSWTLVVLANGMENIYVTNPRTVAEAMVEIRPDAFCSVPRLYEKVYAVAHEQAGTGVKRKVFDWAVRTGFATQSRRRAGKSVPAHLLAANAIADRLVLHRVRDAVGGPKRLMASGGAATRREVIEFFLAADLEVYEGYGLTETAPMVSCNSVGQVRIGSVGRPIPRCEVRIADNGEILVRGPNVFNGYWHAPELTEEVFTDGWFRTGDIGHLDEDGYLYVTDRLKDLIITAQGKNIAPAPLENHLSADPLIESAVVVGDNRKYLVALLQPNFAGLEEIGHSRGWPVSDRNALVHHPDVQALYEQKVTAAGQGMARHEQIQKFRLLPGDLSVDSGEITPTLKVKRRIVAEHFAHLIEDMYGPESARV